VAAAAATHALPRAGAQEQADVPASGVGGGRGGPVVIASANGLSANEKAMELIRGGADPLDAVVAGVNIVENDPNDNSVGYGGLPNEDGVVELDASVMHGPTGRAGAVASLRNIKNPSSVALKVLRRTDHVLLVGDGALRFAKAHGFKEEDLLTDASREAWLKWKEHLSTQDDWVPEEDSEAIGPQSRGRPADIPFTYGTINCNAVDASGNIAGVTTTSGLAYKIPGRVGDSPIIGAGLFVDNAVGAAGSTGRGEAVLQIAGAHTVVELMRSGMDPVTACLEALKRIVDGTRLKHLRRADGRPDFDVKFYAVAKDGHYGGAGIWSGGKFAVHDGQTNRLVEAAWLYETVK
jgi:N4-(beta-N-acetylglucosaminyl)-L-asparaginase